MLRILALLPQIWGFVRYLLAHSDPREFYEAAVVLRNMRPGPDLGDTLAGWLERFGRFVAAAKKAVG